jgi:hypothetical protein
MVKKVLNGLSLENNNSGEFKETNLAAKNSKL